MEREYIWAAHDTAGVNDLHVAIDWFDREAWPIQDPHNQSVYGYTDPVGELVEQRVYAPFGQILSADKTPLATPSGLYFDFRLRLGMHGMFAERLDATTTDPLLRHADARVVYLTPNRTYDPQTGLWWQRDSNATGLLTQGSLAWGGRAILMDPGTLDAEAHYTDGLHLSQALGGSPIDRSDPTGLFLLADIGAANYIGTGLNEAEGQFANGLISSVDGFLNGASQQHMLIQYMASTAIVAGASAFAAGAFDDLLKNLNKSKSLLNIGGWAKLGAEAAQSSKGLRYGSFTIIGWTGYPAGYPRPTGPFRLISGEEYTNAVRLKRSANKALHLANPHWNDMLIHEIHPLEFGGSPAARHNKTL